MRNKNDQDFEIPFITVEKKGDDISIIKAKANFKVAMLKFINRVSIISNSDINFDKRKNRNCLPKG